MECRYLYLAFFAVFCAVMASVSGRCKTEDLTTSNFLLQPWTFAYIKVDVNNGVVGTSIAGYGPREHHKFFYETKFHDCGDSKAYISVKNLKQIDGVHYYLANTQVNSPVDLVDVVADNNEPFLSFKDRRLFRYSAAASVDTTVMESSTKYVTASRRSNELIYENQLVYWTMLPYITRTADITRTLTFLKAAFNINGREADVFVYFLMSRTIRLISSLSPSFNRLTAVDLQFEVILWRYYKGFASDGSVITGSAIVLRKPDKNRYITMDVYDGYIPLPQSHCIYKYYSNHYYQRQTRYTVCFNYQTAKFKYYNQVSRSRNSTFERADIRQQHTVDERFFEAIDDFDGTHKMRSVLDPTKYLAMLKVSDSHFELVMMDLRDDLSGIVNYKFDVNVPPRRTEVMAVPRFPCTPDIPRIPSLYECF